MPAAYAGGCREPPLFGRRGRDRAPERVKQLRGPGQCDVRRQFFLAGTARGLAGLAVRARLTRAEVALAGAFLAAGVVFLAVTRWAPEFGASTAFSALALVLLAASSTLSSALSAILVALAAVFCATDVALLETLTTVVALSSSTSSRVSSTASTADS